MKFKKDYINFLLHKTVYAANVDFKDDPQIKNIADKIISVDDIGKVTFLVGKTAGLESLFKYLLYISDKIDKSQISIFNLKDNIDYDTGNLRKIYKAIIDYNTEKTMEKIEEISTVKQEEKHTIKIELTDDEPSVAKVNLEKEEPVSEEEEKDEQDSGMTLIENPDNKSGEVEVFELDSISKTVENTDLVKDSDSLEEQINVAKEYNEYEEIIEESDVKDNDIKEQNLQIPLEPKGTEIIDEKIADEQKEFSDIDTSETEVVEITDEGVLEEEAGEELIEEFHEEEIAEKEPELDIEVRKHITSDLFKDKEEPVREESVPNEAYYKFETKFFEEVKILEKLLATVDKEFKNTDGKKLSEKSLQSLTEIIEITSELSNLSRQLMFDLIADVFLTMNLYFTKVIGSPEIFDSEKNMLFDSSLALVNSLIKGEDYLNYDLIIEKIENLKKQHTRSDEEQFKDEKTEQTLIKEEMVRADSSMMEHKTPESREREPEVPKPEGPEVDSALFKLKYLVKEFEKSFNSINTFKGEYSRFEALDKINELNNALRLIAKISSSVKQNDVLKLAEVSYVFLKYLKDYRIDLLDAEIQQIIKYIIFTFKMLLTSRKPDDFNILVQHLNNPVKIFTDT